MKFLLLNQFFAPDPAPTGQLLADLAGKLTTEGHEVTVLCSRGGYVGRILAASDRRLASVRVLHTRALAFSHSPAGRIGSWASYYLCALLHLLLHRYDVVVTLTTPPLLSLAGELARRLRRCRHYVWEMDVYPDVAVAVGALKPNGILTRLAGALADFARRHADGVIALGPCMRDRLVQRGLPPSCISVAENWADPAAISPRQFPQGPLTVLYSGNLGLVHEFDTVAAAIALLRDDPRVRFVFAGGGMRRPAAIEFCRTHANGNVHFLPYQDGAEMATHLAACHIGLVTQEAAALGCVVSSKTYPLMASGRPILFIGPEQSTPARIIREFDCGWVVSPGETDRLVTLLTSLAERKDLVRCAGGRARAALEHHYTKDIGVARIRSILDQGDAVHRTAGENAPGQFLGCDLFS